MGGMAKEESGSSNNDSKDFGNSKPKPSNLLNETKSFPASNLNDGANSNLLETTDLYQKPSNTNTAASGLTNNSQKNKTGSYNNPSVVYDDGVSDLEPSIVSEIDTAKEMDKKNDQFAKQQLKRQKEKAELAEQEKKAHYKRLDQQKKAQTLATTEKSTKPITQTPSAVTRPIQPQSKDLVSNEAKEDSESLANTIANKSGEMNGLPPVIDTMISDDPLEGVAVSNDFTYRLEKLDPEAARRYRELVHPIHQKHAPAINKAQAEVDARYQRELDAYNQYNQPHPEVNKLLEDETSILPSGKHNDLIHGDSGDDILETGVRFDENGDMEIVDRDQAIASGYLTDEETFTALRSPQKPSEPLRITEDNQVLDQKGQAIDNIIASEDGHHAILLNLNTGQPLSYANGTPVTADLTNSSTSAADIRKMRDAASFTQSTLETLRNNKNLTEESRSKLAAQAKEILEGWPAAYDKLENAIYEKSSYSPWPDFVEEKKYTDIEDMIYNSKNYHEVTANNEYFDNFESDEAYEEHLEQRKYHIEQAHNSLKSLFILQDKQDRKSISSNRGRGQMSRSNLSLTEIQDKQEKSLTDFINHQTEAHLRPDLPYKQHHPDQAALEVDLARSDLEEGIDSAMMAMNFIPSVGGYKMGVKAAAEAMKIGSKGVKKILRAVMGADKFQKMVGQAGQLYTAQQAGQKAGMAHLANHMIQQGIDPTDRDAMLSYVKENKKAYHQAMMIGVKAMNSSYIGGKIEDGVFGKVSKKMNLKPMEEVFVKNVYDTGIEHMDKR